MEERHGGQLLQQNFINTSKTVSPNQVQNQQRTVSESQSMEMDRAHFMQATET
jgi:hypothetical protein